MRYTPYKDWEVIVGLEIHVQLKTRSKLFSRSPNRFGDEPNTNIDMIDTGQPGALPVLNQEAIAKAVLFGLAIQSKIAPMSKFDRKSYFYPDSPRNFQITQYDKPLLIGGTVIADVEGQTKEFQIDHAHLEDDAGMLKHFSEFVGIDYNRAGIPLLEIVSTPCMFSPKDASSYAMAIKAIMQYLDVSDCNMEEGSLRIDTNISVRPKGEQKMRNKNEIKNLNSFTNMELAIEAEMKRQVNIYLENPNEDFSKCIPSQTLRFDVEKKETIPMRFKEEAKDYRYCPEPNLPPIYLSQEYIEKLRQELPELPHERFHRYVNQLKLSKYNASILINDKLLADYFEKGLKNTPHASLLCNWMTVEFVGRFKDIDKLLYHSSILPEHIAKLVNFIHEKKITGRIAKEVADIMVQNQGKDPECIINNNPNFQALNDEKMIEAFVIRVLDENASSIEAFKKGKDKAFNFLVGQVMKYSKGKASPEIVKDILLIKLAEK